ncbi:MAG TPA: nodulation protein NfeD [Candidatus Acidoferrales bacterium]|nr:nodulation protein NfeD [Candidatus Acidoferrales bacterium]
MKRQFRTAAILLAVVFSMLAAQAQVVRVRMDGPITPMTEEYLSRVLEKATQRHADAVLIELSTPGGLVDSTRAIVGQILASPVPIIAYVTPTGAHAASAGFFILEAADVAAMSPGTNTGASSPVTLGKMDDTMRSKVENDLAAFLRSYVSKRNHNADLAETAVRKAVSWTDEDALKLKLIDVVSPNETELLRTLDGRTITRFNGSTVVLHLANKPVEEYPMTLRQRILAWLLDPNVAFILLAVGALALYAEFNHPGAVIPGVVGVIFILLAAFALNLLPTRFAALALILLAFALFALEAKFATHGVLSVGGIVSLTIGALLLVDGPIPELRVSPWIALAVSVPLGVITTFLMSIALKARRNKVATGKEGLIGEVGLTQTELSPRGKVFLQGALWDACADRPIAIGSLVRVRKVNGLELDVEPAQQPVTQAK